MIGFTEEHYKHLNWQQVEKRFSALYKALPLMHHISPWNFDKVPEDIVSARDRKRKLEPLPFNGWPQRRRKVLKAEASKLHQIFSDTFLPSKWWLGVYYGAVASQGYLLCLLWKHPRHVFWWLKLFASIKRRWLSLYLLIWKDLAALRGDSHLILSPINLFSSSGLLLIYSWIHLRLPFLPISWVFHLYRSGPHSYCSIIWISFQC